MKQNVCEILESRRLLSLAVFGTETTVPGFGSPADTDVAVAADGSYLFANSTFLNGRNTVNFVRYRADGRRATDATTVYSFDTATANPIQVSAAIDADGDAVVVYRTREGDAFNVYFNRITRSNVVGPQVLLDSIPVDVDNFEVSVNSPAVSMGSAGSFFAGWISQTNRSDHEVRVRAFDAAGNPRAAEFVAYADSGAFREAAELEVDAAADGNTAAFAYVEEGGDFNTGNVRFGRINTTARIGDIHHAEGDTGSQLFPFQSRPSVASFADGSFLLAYGESRFSLATDEGTFASFVERYDASGNLLKAIKFDGTNGATALTPSVDVMPDGGFVLTFSRNNGDTTSTLYAQRFSAAGTAASDVVELDRQFNESSTLVFRDVELGTDAGGNAVVVYPDTPAIPQAHYRRLTDEIAAIDNTALYLVGTSRADSLSVKAKGGSYVAARGNTTLAFARSRVSSVSIEGFNGNDTIFVGIGLRATVSGGNGDDTITSGGGDDALFGNVGRDLIFGGDGNDEIFGNAGNDSMRGGEGDDRIEAGSGDDTARGERGQDLLLGDFGDDVMLGGPFNDTLHGHEGNDKLYGDDDNDEFDGGSGRDYFRGGNGHDFFKTVDGELDNVFGDGGRDTFVIGDEDKDNYFDIERSVEPDGL